MPSFASLLVFSGATLVLLVVPGPAVTYIVSRTVAQGRRAGLLSVAGIHLGTMVHVVAALVGLSAVLAGSATAFTVVKLAGAVYLIHLGIRAFRGREAPVSGEPAVRSDRRVFIDGFVVNVLNPKTAIFFLAFVPQFVDPTAGSVTGQLLVLGGVFIALGIVSDATYAIAAAWLAGRWWRRPLRTGWARWASGSIYIGLGAVTALGGSRTTN